MPVLPLPGGCELKAITKFRNQRREPRLHQQYMDTADSDFQFEPFGEAVARRNSPTPGVIMINEHFSDKELDLEVPSTSRASDDSAAIKLVSADPQQPNLSNIATPTCFEVLAQGEGFLAINATIDGCEYSGMLFKTESLVD
uniref:Uncharacterized protein n=1 Tax=Ditylenchus dipsaci TaxID=166011 RepID=A0A915EG11_9BILA